LKRIVEEAHTSQTTNEVDVAAIETAFPYRHANNICWLADDLRLLVRCQRVAVPPVIARAMLESFFYLAACKTVPKFAARKTLWEMDEFLRRSRMFAKVHLDDSLAEERVRIAAFMERVEQYYKLTSNERHPWLIAQCIDHCGDPAFLKANYFFLSQHTHSSFLGLAARHHGGHDRIVQQSVIGTLIIGGGIAAQVLPNKKPQAHVDQAARLLGELLQVIDSGVLDPRELT
jgi:hypothetical protein